MGKKKKSKRQQENAKTKQYKIKANKNKENKTKKTKKKSKVKKIILISILVLFLICLIATGIFAGYFFGIFGDEFVIPQEDLLVKNAITKVYDINGDLIETLSGDEVRETVSLDGMPKYLPDAFVSIEDKRFYEHHGVDIKRTAAATVSFIFNKGSSSFGGSSITQQLVKNITKEDDRSAMAGVVRKVKEMGRAYNLEKTMSKDQILELYLNIIYMGNSGGSEVYGVKVAAKHYFNKDISELDLAECAFLAGINHSPNLYSPFSEAEEQKKLVKDRTITVLFEMKANEKISEEEYNSAVEKVNNGLPFNRGTIKETVYSYHTDAALNQIIKQWQEEKNFENFELARLDLFSGGYNIYTTQDSKIQNIVEAEGKKTVYSITSRDGKKQKSQAGMAIINHTNGQVVAVLGGLGEKQDSMGWNWATQGKKATGSSMKPLAVVAPGIEARILTAGTVYDDVRTTFSAGYTPKNYDWGYEGLMNIRTAIEVSENIPFLKGILDVGYDRSLNFLKSIGMNLPEKDRGLSLALGGLTDGVSPLQMAAGYAAIANNGVYITPIFFTKVTDESGNVVLEPKQESNRVLSEQTAYIMQDLLKQPVIGGAGTARYCAISGMDVAAKTGTTSDDYDRWLCGFTPYYSAACWFGYKDNAQVYYSGNPSGNIWDSVMTQIHKGLPGKRFTRPSGIVSVTICKDSGLIATDICRQDQRGSRAYTEIFVKGTAPSKTCDCHVKVKVCEQEGTLRIANEFCKDAKEVVFITRKDAEKNTAWKTATDAKYMLPTETCTTHVKEEDKTKPDLKLNGESTITLKVGEKYEEKGAKATDTVDGDLTEKITIEGKVDTSKVGTYVLTYKVKDNSNNEATVKRTIKVIKKDEQTNNTVDSGNNIVNNSTTNNTTMN